MNIYSIKTNSGIKYFSLEDGKIKTNSVKNAGLWVTSMGGVEAMISKSKLTEFKSLEEAAEHYKGVIERNEKMRLQNKNDKTKNAEAAYASLIKRHKVIPCTPENIRIILMYLNTINWGSWELPAMDIGYVCHQHECEGHIVTTMTLDRPIEYYGKMENALNMESVLVDI